MAYQNSVYNRGSEPHTGSASDIPQPPPPLFHQPAPPYPRARHKSDTAVGRQYGRQNAHKFKAELRVLPEDNIATHREVKSVAFYTLFY